MPTDPVFARYVTRDVDFHGTRLPEGAVLHLCLGAANRDPARWERPDYANASEKPPTVRDDLWQFCLSALGGVIADRNAGYPAS